jgi:hypothetical protein
MCIYYAVESLKLIEVCFISGFNTSASIRVIYIQGEHKITLHFQNYTENKCGVLRTHTYTSRYKNSQSFVHTSQRLDMCSASHAADVETII